MSEPYVPPAAPPPSGPPAHGRPGLPWDRERTGNALVETTKRLVKAPGEAFAEVREKGDYLAPVLYALIFGTFGAVLYQIWQLLFGAAMSGPLVDTLPPEMRAPFAEAFAPSVAGLVVGLVFAPIGAVIGLFIGAGIYHLFLLLVGGTRNSTAGFEGTVRAVAYASTSNLAQLIPVIGILVAVVWSLVLNVIGLARIHNTTTGRALAAVLLPILVCCLCGLLVVFAAGGIGALAMGANQ